MRGAKDAPSPFSELLELHPGDRDQKFMQYIRSGSLPNVDPEADETFEREHLIGMFSTMVLKDVTGRMGSADSSILEDICRYLYSNVGNITSCNSIANDLKISYRDAKRYVKALESAYLFYKCERFDIRGRKLLDTLEKYYVSDTGMRNTVRGISSREDISRRLRASSTWS